MPISLLSVVLAAGLAGAEPPTAAVPPVMGGHRSSTVGAATTPDAAEASLLRLLDRARRENPTLAALRARRAAAGQRITPAGALGDPMLEVELRNMGLTRWTVGRDPDSMVDVTLRQSLPWPGIRDRRRDAAAADAAVVEAELVAASRALSTEVHHRWSAVYALDREEAYLADSHDLLELLAATVAARYGTGDGDQAAVLRVQVELADHTSMITRLDGERADLLAQLRGLAALGPNEALPTIAALPPITPPAVDWIATAVARAPEIDVARAGVARASLALELARLDTKPGLAALAGYGFRGRGLDGGGHEQDPAITLGLGVELRAWRRDKQRPLVTAAEQELAGARAEVAAAELAARSAAERLAAAWQRVNGELQAVDQGLIPQTSGLLDATRTAYLNGRSDFTAVIEAFTRWLDVRIRRERLAAERFSVRAEIASLTALPSPADTEVTP